MATNPNLPPALQDIINRVLSQANPAPARPLVYKPAPTPYAAVPDGVPTRPLVYKNPGFGPSTVSAKVTPSTNLTALFSSLPNNYNPKLLKLQTQNDRMKNLIMGLGATPAKHGPNALHRIIDVLSRPLYAVVNPAMQLEKSINNGDSFGQALQHTLGGVVHGLSGTQKALTSDIFQYSRDRAHASNRAENDYQQFLTDHQATDSPAARAQFAHQNNYKIDIKGNFTKVPITPGEGGRGSVPEIIAGILGDTVLDPLSYVGLGVVSNVAKDTAKIIESGKLLEDVKPGIKILRESGVIAPDMTDAQAARFFIGPQVGRGGVPGRAIPVPSEISTEGMRDFKSTMDRAWGAIYKHNIKVAQDQMAANGTPILKNSELPPVVKVPDFSDPKAVAAHFKTFQRQVTNWELLSQKAHPVIFPNELRSPRRLQEALHKAAQDGNEARRLELVRDPKTGKDLRKATNNNVAEIWRRQFAALNNGAKSVEEATIKQAKRTADLRNPQGKLANQIRQALIKHQSGVIHQVAASQADVQKMREFIGRDPAKLTRFVTTGAKNGPFDEHIGTLAHFIEKDKKDHIGHPYTEEMRQAAENHWWERQYVNAARNMERAADLEFASGVEHMAPREAAIAKANYLNAEATRLNKVYAGNPDAHNLVQRALGFSKQQWDKTVELRKSLLSDSEKRIKGLPVGEAIAEARSVAEKFKPINPKDFVPTRIDSTERDAARLVNEQRKAELGKTVSEHTDKQYQDVKDSLEAAVHIAFSPEIVKQVVLRVGIGQASVEIMRSPELLAKYMRQFLESDNLITKSLKSFEHAFVSTGNMAPEIAALKNASAGRVHQMVRYTLERLDKEFTQLYKPKEVSDGFRNWLHGNTINPDMAAKFDEHFKEFAKQLRDPDMRRLGYTLRKLNGFMPDGTKLDLPMSDKVIRTYLDKEDSAVQFLKNAVRGKLATASVHRDPIEWLLNLHLAADRAITNAKLIDNIINSWGISIKDVVTGKTSNAVHELVTKRGYKTLQRVAEADKIRHSAIPKLLQNYVFEPKIAKDLARTLEMLHDNRSIEDFSRLVSKAVQPWKAAVTVWNIPAYQTRNALQNTYMMWLALREIHSNTVSMQKSLAISAKSIRGSKINPALKRTLSPYDFALTHQEGNTSKIMFRNRNALGRPWRDIQGNDINVDMLDGAYLDNGLDNGFITNQFGNRAKLTNKIAELGPGKANLHNLNKVFTDANQSLENYFRKALFIDAIRNSTKNTFEEAAQDAAHVVRKYLFDYNDLTPFEKHTMVNIIPFYKWTRKAVPVMIETMFTQPGKIINPLIVQRDLAQGLGATFDPNDPYKSTVDKVLPDWIADTMQFPFGKIGGSTIYSGLALPFTDVAGTVTSTDQLFGMLNPAIRVPMELKMGQQFYHNIPIKNGLEYATLGQLPQTSKLKNLMASLGPGPGQTPPSTGGTALLNILKNLGLTQTTVNDDRAKISQLTKELQQHQIQHKSLVNKLTGQG